MKTFILLSLISFSLFAHESLQTNTHQDLLSKVKELRTKYAASDILIVYDIDNTLLRASQPLGSDQWFEWQAEAIKLKSPDSMFKSIEELLSLQGDFFQLSQMTLTEGNLPLMIQRLKRNGHYMALLTSRSPELRSVTERELVRNKLWFEDRSIMPGVAKDFSDAPFQKIVSFRNGVFMTAGHHKGEALQYLIAKSRKNFKAIIFIDDHERHTKRVFETMSKNESPEIITFRYGHQDQRVEEFKRASKNSIIQQTRDFLRMKNALFNN